MSLRLSESDRRRRPHITGGVFLAVQTHEGPWKFHPCCLSAAFGGGCSDRAGLAADNQTTMLGKIHEKNV